MACLNYELTMSLSRLVMTLNLKTCPQCHTDQQASCAQIQQHCTIEPVLTQKYRIERSHHRMNSVGIRKSSEKEDVVGLKMGPHGRSLVRRASSGSGQHPSENDSVIRNMSQWLPFFFLVYYVQGNMIKNVFSKF